MTLQKLTVHLTTIIFGAAIALVLGDHWFTACWHRFRRFGRYFGTAVMDATLACVDQNGCGPHWPGTMQDFAGR